jgi:HAE1 family hydrophobic/amphiphilic exporter-1
VKITRGAKYVDVCKSFSTDKNTDQKFLYNYADINVLSELKRVNGVGSGDILGTREYAMRIWLKPDRMLAYKISTDEVMEALSSQSLEASPENREVW